MIYLIGGSPKCGKTTLAKQLSKVKKIPWVSTDSLETVVRSYYNKKDISKNFPASLQRGKSNDEKYSKYSTKEIISAYCKQAKTLHLAIEMFILAEITDGNDYIIEGYHIEPKLIDQLNKKYQNNIKSVFLVKDDINKFILNIKKSSTPNDWIIARTKKEETYLKIAKMISEYGKFFEREAKKYNLKTINMDNNFTNKIKEAIKYFL